MVERGLAFSKAVQLKENSINADDGFYMSNEDRMYCRLPILALSMTSKVNVGNMRKTEQLFRIYRPNTGLQQRHETLESLRKKYEKVKIVRFVISGIICVFGKISPIEAQVYWDELYNKAAMLCIHFIR